MTQEKEFISLKEAAKISGYSSDYIGQLIRGGKLSGKQIFSNVSWVTTESAILEYIQKEKKGKTVSDSIPSSVKDFIFNTEGLARTYVIVAWVLIGLLGLFVVFLISVFAISVDNRINQKYMQQVWQQSSQ